MRPLRINEATRVEQMWSSRTVTQRMQLRHRSSPHSSIRRQLRGKPAGVPQAVAEYHPALRRIPQPRQLCNITPDVP